MTDSFVPVLAACLCTAYLTAVSDVQANNKIVDPNISVGRVRYDNFVMQRGWCLAHRLLHHKIIIPHAAQGIFGVHQAPTTNVVNP